MRARDLFDLFPDLPRPRRRDLQQRVRDIRARAAEVQQQVRVKAARQQAAAERWRHEWRKRRGW